MQRLGRAVPGALAPVPTCIPHGLPGKPRGAGRPTLLPSSSFTSVCTLFVASGSSRRVWRLPARGLPVVP